MILLAILLFVLLIAVSVSSKFDRIKYKVRIDRLIMSDLNFISYQERAKGTAKKPAKDELTTRVLGLVGEAGEVAEEFKRYYRSGKLNKEAIIKELGDVLWYISAISDLLEIDLETVAKKNLEKLESRKERDVIFGKGNER